MLYNTLAMNWRNATCIELFSGTVCQSYILLSRLFNRQNIYAVVVGVTSRKWLRARSVPSPTTNTRACKVTNLTCHAL